MYILLPLKICWGLFCRLVSNHSKGHQGAVRPLPTGPVVTQTTSVTIMMSKVASLRALCTLQLKDGFEILPLVATEIRNSGKNSPKKGSFVLKCFKTRFFISIYSAQCEVLKCISSPERCPLLFCGLSKRLTRLLFFVPHLAINCNRH